MNDRKGLFMRMKGFILLAPAFLGVFFILQGCGVSKSNEDNAEPRSAEVSGVSTDQSAEESKPNVGARVNAAGVFKAFSVYTDANAPDNHYVPSGWMGDYGDLKFNDRYMTSPHSGSTSVQIVYNGKGAQGARWAGIYWQNPPNNWGSRPGGYDLTGAKKLSFWARGESGGERIEEFKIGGITGEYADSDVAGIGPVVLTTDWQEYTIDLEGKDLSSISGGFCWATNVDVNPEGCTFYLDDIRYE